MIVCAPSRSASTTGIGGTPRRATPAATSRPCRSTASSQPPRPSGRAPTSSGTAASAASRCARSSARMSPASRSRRRAASSKRCRAASVVHLLGRSRPVRRRRGRRPAPAGRAPPARTRSGSAGPAHGARHRCSSCSAHGVAAAPRAGMRSVHGRSGTASSTVSTAATAARRLRNGPSAPSRGVLTTDSRGNASAVGRDPPAPVRPPGPAVVRRLVGRDQPQLAHRGLQRVRAHHGVHPLGQRDHVPDPAPSLPGGEVAAHPPPQVAAGADVEHLVAGPAEQVHPGRGGHRRRPAPACGACSGSGGAARTRGPARAAPPGSARPRLPTRSSSRCSTSTVHRASASARWVGRVAVPNSRASAPSRTLGASSGAQHGAGQPGRAQHRWPRPGAARAARRRRAGNRRRTGRCARRARRRAGTPAPRAAPPAAAARR